MVHIEESKDVPQKMFKNSKDSDIEHMFEGLTDYDDDSLDSYDKKYTSYARKNKK